MQHSIKEIGKFYEEVSKKRNDFKLFDSSEFFNFAKTKIEKYHIVEHGDDLLISTWWSGELINDYRASILIEVCDIINNIPHQPQVQYDLNKQLKNLRSAANRLGLHDAAYFLK